VSGIYPAKPETVTTSVGMFVLATADTLTPDIYDETRARELAAEYGGTAHHGLPDH
jgi:hypothetical protein